VEARGQGWKRQQQAGRHRGPRCVERVHGVDAHHDRDRFFFQPRVSLDDRLSRVERIRTRELLRDEPPEERLDRRPEDVSGLGLGPLRFHGAREGFLQGDRFPGFELGEQFGVEVGVVRHLLLEVPKGLALLLGAARRRQGLFHFLRDLRGLALLVGPSAGAGQNGDGQAERRQGSDQKTRHAAASE
jgi:hypothetical protein